MKAKLIAKICGSTIVMNYLRSLKHDPGTQLLLTQVSDDIWFTDFEVEAHTDNTEAGKNTALMVLVNDAIGTFQCGNKIIGLRVGQIIRFDGNQNHFVTNYRKDRSAFLIWDIPTDKPDEDIINEMVERLRELEEIITKDKKL